MLNKTYVLIRKMKVHCKEWPLKLCIIKFSLCWFLNEQIRWKARLLESYQKVSDGNLLFWLSVFIIRIMCIPCAQIKAVYKCHNKCNDQRDDFYIWWVFFVVMSNVNNIWRVYFQNQINPLLVILRKSAFFDGIYTRLWEFILFYRFKQNVFAWVIWI